LNDAFQAISQHKYNLNKLDSELGYFENLNDQHKAAQQQLFKANEYEYLHSKDNTLKYQELEITLSKLEQDQQSIHYDLERLK